MIPQAIRWTGGVDGHLDLIDQRRLPVEFTRIQCRRVEQLFEAIQTLAVRGAPAIGVSAAYGPILALQRLDPGASGEEALQVVEKTCDYLATSRPTAVNLFWALDRMKAKARPLADADVKTLRKGLLAEAHAIHEEDVEMCRQIGVHGARLVEDGIGVLTHCNAGALATAGQGTALSVLFEAHRQGKQFRVYADETRPLLQGARLTAWELQQAGIDVTVLCDNMAGWLMKQGKIDVIITGADRIAANGDTANKIGTYSLSVLAHAHGIHFYIAAPSSTFDLNIRSGAEIPIEQRQATEVTRFRDVQTAPADVDVYNPAFDIVDADKITAIITEKGVIERPTSEKIRASLAAH